MLGWASWGTLRCAHDHGAATGEAFPGGRIEQAPAAFAPQHQPRALRRLGVCRICARPAHFSQFRSGVCPSRSISRRVPTGLIGLQFQSQPVASWPLTRVVECAGDDTRHLHSHREPLALAAAVTLRSGIADRIGGKDGGSRSNLPHLVNFPPDAVRGLARQCAFFLHERRAFFGGAPRMVVSTVYEPC